MPNKVYCKKTPRLPDPRKKKKYTMEEKLEVIKESQAGKPETRIAREKKMNQTSVHSILIQEKKEEIKLKFQVKNNPQLSLVYFLFWNLLAHSINALKTKTK